MRTPPAFHDLHGLHVKSSFDKWGNRLAMAIIVAFAVAAIVKLYPFKNELEQVIGDAGNDWSGYAIHALDIRHHGWLMPNRPAPYVSPASFLYVYFLAGSFALFGEHTAPVYFIQTVLLGVSVALVYWTFRHKMRGSLSLWFLAAATAFAVVDVTKYYTFRFLGENVATFTLALFFYSFFRGLETTTQRSMLVAAALMGVSVLVRPNLFLFEVAVLVIAIIHYRRTRSWPDSAVKALAFAAVLVASTSFLLIRNHALSDSWRFLPDQGDTVGFFRYLRPVPPSVDLSHIKTNWFYTTFHTGPDVAAYAEFFKQQPWVFLKYYLNKTLFCFGFLPAVEPEYRYRPHWMVMWAGFFAYVWMRLRSSKRLEIWELTVLVFVVCYYSVPIVAAPIHNYGFRMLIPATNIVLACAFLAVERWLPSRALEPGTS